MAPFNIDSMKFHAKDVVKAAIPDSLTSEMLLTAELRYQVTFNPQRQCANAGNNLSKDRKLAHSGDRIFDLGFYPTLQEAERRVTNHRKPEHYQIRQVYTLDPNFGKPESEFALFADREFGTLPTVRMPPNIAIRIVSTSPPNDKMSV